MRANYWDMDVAMKLSCDLEVHNVEVKVEMEPDRILKWQLKIRIFKDGYFLLEWLRS